jgi:DNA invertase Pin-like site-specific DNA recombinase
MHEDDILIVSELSRLGRSLLEVMSNLHTLMEKDVKVFTTKEHYELGNNISSKVLAFAFSLSAEIGCSSGNTLKKKKGQSSDQCG